MPLPPYLMSNFPSVRPSLNLQFDSQPTPEDMTSHLASVGATFSRASIGTYTDANGLIQEASAGQARPNYSTAGVHEGLLIEESRVNLYKFGQTPYLGIADDATLRQGGAYGSAYFTDVIVDNGVTVDTGTSQGFGFDVNATTGDHTFSFIVKGGNGIDEIRVRRSTIGVDTVQVLVLDLTDGTLDLDALGATVIDLGSNTYYVAFTDNANASGSVAGYYIKPNVGQTCDGVNYFSLAGLQAEAGSFPTSYIPTIPTFSSRASTATYFDSSGVLQTQAIQTSPTGVGRIDHKYIDGQWVEAGLLLEGASTNLLVQSEDLSTTWATNQITITTNQIDAPDGNTTADKASPDTSQGSVYQALAITSSTTYTYSVYLKKAENDFGMLRAQWDGTTYDTVNFDLVNGTTSRTPSGVDSTSIEDVGNGWYRCIVTFTPSSSVTTNFQIRTSNLEQTTSNSIYTGTFNGTNGIYAWGAQVEAQSQATSYIKTTTASATRSADVYTTATKTRSADVCYIDGTAFTDFYNQEQGTWYANIVQKTTELDARIFDANDGTSTNRMLMNGYQPQIAIGASGAGVTVNIEASENNLGTKKVGSYYDSTRVELYEAGAELGFDDSLTLPTSISELYIGDSGYSTTFLNGSIKKLIYFPRRLSDNELIKLTQ